MTPEEFSEQFWPTFGLRFDEVERWIAKLPATSNSPSEPTQQKAMKLWRSALADVTIEDANGACDAIFRGDEDRPRSWSEYPAAIRRIARASVAKRTSTRWTPGRKAGEEPRYRCLLCRDDGRVLVWHEASMKAALQTPDAFTNCETPTYKCVVACSCRAGEAACFEHWQRYNPERHVAIPEIDVMRLSEARYDLVRIVAERDVRAPMTQRNVSYESDFT